MNKKVLPFGFEQAQDSPGFLLWQTTIIWQRRIKKALELHDISHPQFVIMAITLWFEIHQIDPTQVAIINWSKLDKMTVSQSLKKLAALKLVHRSEHKTDTRAKNVVLTPAGKELVSKLIPIVEQIDDEFFGVLPTDDQRSLITVLNKLVVSDK